MLSDRAVKGGIGQVRIVRTRGPQRVEHVRERT
jgi:hypothetical protein